jgi:hypothetical protein
MADQLRTVLNKKGSDGRANKRAVAEKLVEMALEGHIEAAKVIFDRIDGKVPQTNVLEGNPDAPIAQEVVLREETVALLDDLAKRRAVNGSHT